jgi:DNA polymerase III alpha subunit
MPPISKADLHVHTTASDGTTTVPALLAQLALTGIRLVAITDHDTIVGALLARRLASDFGVEVIVGEEGSADASIKTSRSGARPTSWTTTIANSWRADYGVSALTRVLQLASTVRVPQQLKSVLMKSVSEHSGCSMYSLAM